MLTRQESVEHLNVSLTRQIQNWMDSNCEGEAWESLDSHVGEDCARLMAKAALAVLEAQVDLSRYLKEQNYLEA